MGAGLLLLVAEDLVAGWRARRGQVVASVRLWQQARFLAIDAGQHVDRRASLDYVIDRGLQVAKSALQALRVKVAIRVLQVRGERRDARREIRVVLLAHEQVR